VVDGVMVHPSDSEAWKHFNSVHSHFSVESRNVRLELCTNGFNPFGSFFAPYSYWLVILVVTHFWVHTKQNEKIQKISKNIQNKSKK